MIPEFALLTTGQYVLRSAELINIRVQSPSPVRETRPI